MSTVLGVGLDLVAVDTIRLSLSKDAENIHAWFSEAELLALADRRTLPHILAGRVAAKEAVAKALGCGFADQVAWQDVEIYSADDGRPIVRLSGGAAEVAASIGAREVLVSITHLESMAAATAIASR